MGTQAFHILRAYCDRLRMMSCMGEYYGAASQGFWWVTHGVPLYPTIFNVLVDAVMNLWILLVAGGTGRVGEGGAFPRHLFLRG